MISHPALIIAVLLAIEIMVLGLSHHLQLSPIGILDLFHPDAGRNLRSA